MLKKVFSIILAVSVLLSCNAAFASNVLGGLGIDSISASDEFVSRAKFAEAVAVILNGGSAPAPADGVFTDVTSSHECSGSVYYIYNMGLISGYGDSKFGPDDALYAEQAVKILVSALGYDVLAGAKGGYPMGYISVAQSIDLLDGIIIESGKALDGYTASVLLENAVACDMLMQTGFGDTQSYSTIEGRTLLTEYMHLKKITGVVKDNGITSLTGSSAVGEGMVIIGSTVVKAGDTDAELMLGCKVEAYITDDASTYQTIRYIDYSDDCTITKIPARNLLNDDAGFSVTNIVYNDIYATEKSVSVSQDADYIYNGKAFVDFAVSDLDIDFGEVVLVDNDGNSRNDVVIIKEAELVVLDAVNLDTETVYGKDSASPIVLKNKEKVTIVKDGELSGYEALNEWDILNVYQSKDKQYIEIDASSRTIEGVVDELTSVGTVAVNGELFNVCTDALKKRIEVGAEYVFCIDSTGGIAAIKSDVSDSTRIAYFIDAKAQTSGMDKNLSVRVFTEEGDFASLDFAPKATLDGKTVSDTTGTGTLSFSDACAYLLSDADKSLVCYELNSKGLISSMTLPISESEYEFDDENETRFRVDYVTDPAQYSTGIQYRLEQLTFLGKLNMSNTTSVFVIPDDYSKENMFEVIYPSDIYRNIRYFPTGYSIGTPNGRSEYVVYPAKIEYTETSTVVLVDTISSVVNEDGEMIQKLTGYSRTGAETMMSAEENTFSALQPGDVIRCFVDKTGRISDYKLLLDYDPTQDKASIVSANNPTPDSFAAAFRVVYANVYYRYDDLIGTIKTVPNSDVAKADIENQVLTDVPLYSFDNSRKEKILPATTAEINDWLRTGNEYSKVFIYNYNAYARLAVIYK